MIGKALKNVRSGVGKAIKPAPRKQLPVGTAKPVGGVGTTGFKSGKGAVDSSMLKGGPAGGFGVGFGGGAGMAPAKRSPMGSIKNAVGQAVAAKKASDATNRLGKSMLGSMMKKGGAVKKTAAKKGKK